VVRPRTLRRGWSARLCDLAVRRVVWRRGTSKNVPVTGSLAILASFARRGRVSSSAAGGSAADENLALARERLRSGCCHRCGNEIEEGLARVASVLCYDCRAATGLVGLS